MPKNSYDETGSFGMPPSLKGPNTGNPPTSGGKDFGGTANLRADETKHGPVTGSPPSGGNRDVKFAKVRNYTDDSV